MPLLCTSTITPQATNRTFCRSNNNSPNNTDSCNKNGVKTFTGGSRTSIRTLCTHILCTCGAHNNLGKSSITKFMRVTGRMKIHPTTSATTTTKTSTKRHRCWCYGNF